MHSKERQRQDYCKFKASLKEIHTWQTKVDKAFEAWVQWAICRALKTRPHPEVGVWLAEQFSKFPSRENNVARPCEKYDFTYLICPRFRPLYSFQLSHYLFVPFALNWSLLMHCSPQWPQMQTLLLWPLKCWDHMHVTLYPAKFNQLLILFSIFCLYQCFSRYVIYIT